MKVHLFAAMVAASVLSLAPAAVAQTTTSTPPPSGCGGNACPGTQSFSVVGSAVFGGTGASMFQGAEGYNKIEKQGSSTVNLEIKAAGGLCGIDCQDGSFKFQALAGEQVKVQTGAFGTQSGQTVSAQNQGVATVGAGFQVQKLTNPQ